MTPLAASISDDTIWSVTFDDTRSVDYDCNSFIIQATGQSLSGVSGAVPPKKRKIKWKIPGSLLSPKILL